jgi:N-methylhydantoinase B
VSTQARDQFTTEVIVAGLRSIGQEMFVAMQRTSMSPVIYESLDYGIGLIDPQGRLVAQGNGVTPFVGFLCDAVSSIAEKYGADISPGDAFITNDPYSGGGTHLSDVTVARPIFVDGQLVMFSACKAHWTDVGGMAPGSWTTDSTEIFQEGLRFTALRLYRGGVIDETLLDVIRANVRLPDMSMGDLQAQIAAVQVGERRFTELCDKHGTDVVLDAIEWSFDYLERMVRQELALMPKGVFTATDLIDDDGRGNGPFHVQVKVTITDDEFVADFTGSSPQVPGPINGTGTGLLSTVKVLFKGLTSPSLASNDGTFRPVRVVCPPATVFNAEEPSPVSTYWESLLFAAELIWRALAPHMPDRLTAGTLTTILGTIISGRDHDASNMYVMTEPQVGGWGAAHDADGIAGFFALPDAETRLVPIEVSESRHGLRVVRFGYDCDVPGGAGEFRGGRGCVREYEVVTDVAELTASAARHENMPWGAEGGQDGSPNLIEVVRTSGEVETYGFCARIPLVRGDRVRVITATGGGWGSPFRRGLDAVREDLIDGYVTREQARADYGWDFTDDLTSAVPTEARQAYDRTAS